MNASTKEQLQKELKQYKKLRQMLQDFESSLVNENLPVVIERKTKLDQMQNAFAINELLTKCCNSLEAALDDEGA